MSVADDYSNLPEQVAELAKQAHAGIALVVAGYVEEWLQKVLIHHMRPQSNKQLARLFEGYGPLSTFSGRADIAFGFNLIGREVYDDLRVIKDIRNKLLGPDRYGCPRCLDTMPPMPSLQACAKMVAPSPSRRSLNWIVDSRLRGARP
jgi:hypothetical protein